MTTKNGYLAYPTNKPPTEDYYLVSVNPALILKLGLAPSPDILIAKYKIATQEWTVVLGMSGMGLGNINQEVISWRELPR
jgi:hypothetical protein